MQRVATELYTSLEEHTGVELFPVVLRSSWRLTHVRTIPFLFSAYRKAYDLIRRGSIDGILFSSMVTASLAVPLRRRMNGSSVKIAAIAHGRDVTLPTAAYQRFVPHIFGALDAVLPVSRATGEACLERGLPDEKLHVIPNGIDIERFLPTLDRLESKRALASELGGDASLLKDDSFVLCSVGRQVERKGFAWFVREVMPLLPENVSYWLAGEGPEQDLIRAEARRLSLNGRVRLLGRISEETLAGLYKAADLFVMPNRPVAGDMEGFGVVMLEAGLSGLPTVAADIEGIRDVIREGVNGHLVASGDAQAFVRAIDRYNADRKALLEVSERTAHYIRDTFSWANVVERHVDLFKTLPGRQAA